MTADAAVLAGAWLAAGGLVGWAVVPTTADALLRRAYRRSRAWWWECLDAYRRFKEAHPGREPASSARGEEGALGLWLDDAVRTARVGSLARERARALQDAGASVDVGECALGEGEGRDRCSFAPRPWQRAACAGGCAAAFAGIGLIVASGGTGLQAIALACCATAMACAVACDLEARTIPLEACAVLGAAGAVFQLAACGFAGLATGAAYAAVVAVGCLGANRLLARRGKTAVGYGDVRCMAALSLACGAASPLGFAACYACAGAVSIGGLVARRLVASDGIPMAPFLALWLMCGTTACAVA